MEQEVVFLAGAQKSGTSSCFNYLSQHPKCLPSDPKEPSYFSKASKLDCFDNYWCNFPEVDISSVSDDFFFLEGTTGYMVEDYVPRRIKNKLGEEAKFIFLLRDPVERALSAYWHLYKRNHEKREIEEVFLEFSEGLTPEQIYRNERKKILSAQKRGKIDTVPYEDRYDDEFWNFHYIYNSCYSQHLKKFYNLFPERNILTVKFDYFIHNTEQCMEKIVDFIGLKNENFKFELDVHNKTRIPKGPMKKFPVKKLINVIPERIKAILKSLGVVPDSFKIIMERLGVREICHQIFFNPKPEVSSHIKKKLQEILVQEIKYFENLDNLDF